MTPEEYEACRQAGLNPNDPWDWINIGMLLKELKGN